MVIIGWHFNAKTGHPVALHSFNLSTNRNGQMISYLMVQRGLIALNQKRNYGHLCIQTVKKKLWKFLYPNGEKEIIDIYVSKR